MPTDTATQTIEVAAGRDRVLATLRDIGSQPEWIPEIREVEVLEVSDAGLVSRARFVAATAVGTDRYTLAFHHTRDSLSWTMLEGRLQTGQEGRYSLAPAGRGRTRVTYRLTIHHRLLLPGFVRQRVISGLVRSTLNGLRLRLEQGHPTPSRPVPTPRPVPGRRGPTSP